MRSFVANTDRHKEAVTRQNRKYKYGLSEDDFVKLFDAQEGKCATCKALFTGVGKYNVCIDHDKETGKVRGLLCMCCNVSIGHARHDTDVLQAMINYLNVYEGSG